MNGSDTFVCGAASYINAKSKRFAYLIEHFSMKIIFPEGKGDTTKEEKKIQTDNKEQRNDKMDI